MPRYLVGRLAGVLVVVLALVTIVFAARTLIPSDPVRAQVGANASAETVARARERLGLNDPLPAQYVTYLSDAVRGNLGESVRTGRPVQRDIREFLPASIELAIASMMLAIIGGLLIGIMGASTGRGSGVIRTLFVAGAAAPSFLLALVLIYVFYFRLQWLPPSGRIEVPDAPIGPTGLFVLDGLAVGRVDVVIDALRHLILPAVSLALVPAVAIGRVLRSSLLEVYKSDYIRTAHAKGISPRRVLYRHALRNALSAPLSMTGLQLGLLLGGVVVVETVFAWPGIGLYMNNSIQSGDVTAIAGVTLVVGISYVLTNMVVDVTQGLADPRIRI